MKQNKNKKVLFISSEPNRECVFVTDMDINKNNVQKPIQYTHLNIIELEVF